MPAVQKDIMIEQGVTFQFVVDVVYGDTIAGFAAKMQIRKYVDSTEVLAEFSTDDGQITVNNATKQVVVTVPAEETLLYDWGSGVYDIELRGGGKEWRLAKGRAFVSPGVTRD